MGIYVKKRKVAINLPESSPTAIYILYIIMTHIEWIVDKKFQPSIFYMSRENHVSFLHFKL